MSNEREILYKRKKKLEINSQGSKYKYKNSIFREIENEI